MADNFLSEMDNKISINAVLLKTKSFRGLFPPPTIKVRRYYKLEGGTFPLVLGLLTAASSLTKGHSMSMMVRTDVTLAASEMEDFKASSSNSTASHFLDGLVAGTGPGLVNSKPNNHAICALSIRLTRGRVVEYMTNTSTVTWMNCVLKYWDVIP